MFLFPKLFLFLEKYSQVLILPSPVTSFHFLSQEDTYSTIVDMAASDDNSYVLSEQASSGNNDEDDDSEDETLESLAHHACVGHDAENPQLVIDATVVPRAATGVAAAAPPVNSGVDESPMLILQ